RWRPLAARCARPRHASRAGVPLEVPVRGAGRPGRGPRDRRADFLDLVRDPARCAVCRLATRLQRLGVRRRLRSLQLQPLQLRDLWIRAGRAETLARGFGLAGTERAAHATRGHAAAAADPQTDPEAVTGRP